MFNAATDALDARQKAEALYTGEDEPAENAGGDGENAADDQNAAERAVERGGCRLPQNNRPRSFFI